MAPNGEYAMLLPFARCCRALRMATLTSAQVMGVSDRGVIAPGKFADLNLVDGDPLKNMRDLDKITTVIKGGTLYDPAAIEKALGITPRK